MSSWAPWTGALALEEIDHSRKDEDLEDRYNDDNDYDPNEFKLEEGQEKRIVEKQSLRNPKIQELKKILSEWITTTLEHQRIIVQNLEEDLFDGQVLQKLIEHFAKIKLQVNEVTMTSGKQKEKLGAVLQTINQHLDFTKLDGVNWSVDLIHSKDLCAILHLLVSIAKHYRAPIKLPENVTLRVVTVRKLNGQLEHSVDEEQITSDHGDMIRGANEKDAFDALFKLAPEKLNLVKKSLVDFANKHLKSLHLEVTDMDTQFADGVFLIFLMGVLEDYFVPLYLYNAAPETFEEKVKNNRLVFELMVDAGLPKPTSLAEDIAKGELKSTLRVLYSLFSKYKHKKARDFSATKTT